MIIIVNYTDRRLIRVTGFEHVSSFITSHGHPMHEMILIILYTDYWYFGAINTCREPMILGLIGLFVKSILLSGIYDANSKFGFKGANHWTYKLSKLHLARIFNVSQPANYRLSRKFVLTGSTIRCPTCNDPQLG